MNGRVYQKIPIVDTARRCGLVLDPKTLRREEVEASCPFCGDHGRGKYHLSLNTLTDQYRCNLCGAHGNSVTLFARLNGIGNGEAFRELCKGGNIYPIPRQPETSSAERQPRQLAERHEVYTDMLHLLTLSERHRADLLGRGLSDERIERNMYRSMPESEEGKKLLAHLLHCWGHELAGIPGFRTRCGSWTACGGSGFLIPVRDKDGLIQGLKIRLDDGISGRKYRWFSSRGLPDGTRSYSWIHVTGNTGSHTAYLTEGPLKGDAASYLMDDALFVCLGGVNAVKGLPETLVSLGVREVIEAMDMDQTSNPQVRQAVEQIRRIVHTLPNIRYRKYVWNPAYKGVDDYTLSRIAA